MRTNERGQATTETLLLTWVMLALIAATYQLFLVNRTITRSLAVVHTKLFAVAFDAGVNCFWEAEGCQYRSDRNRIVMWSPWSVPEVRIPVVGMFRTRLLGDLRLRSNVPRLTENCPDCKRTKVGAGTYMPPWELMSTVGTTLFDAGFYRYRLTSSIDQWASQFRGQIADGLSRARRRR